MDFDYSDVQHAWRARARTLGGDLPQAPDAAEVVAAAGRAELVDPRVDLLTVAVAVEAMAAESSAAGIVFALHAAALAPLAGHERFAATTRGEAVAALSLSVEHMPDAGDGSLTGRASWLGPVTARGVAIVMSRRGSDLLACAVALDAPDVTLEVVSTAALQGVVFAHAGFEHVPCVEVGPPLPLLVRVRVLLASAALGMGRRALRESLDAARVHNRQGAGGEQTVQGLLADAATELDAAMLLTWKAASAPEASLAEASMAKLAATEATLRAVAHATQVVGAATFRRGHVVERLAQDVRALELFAGRTEVLREAVAREMLPR